MISFCLAACLAASTQAPPTVHIVRDAQDEITLETVGAMSQLPFGVPTPIRLDVPANAVFRFSAKARRPLTVSAADLLTASTWHLAQIRSELFLWAAPTRITPPPAGSVVISGESAACANAETFRLGMTMSVLRNSGMSLGLLTTPEVGSCRWIAIGLPTGNYEAALRNARGSSGRRAFRHIAPETTEVAIPAPAVTLSGIVTINGKPVSGGRMQARRPPEVQIIVLEDDGSYHATFDEEGEYTLVLTAPINRLKPTTVALTLGSNVFDWHLEEPSADSELTVRVTDYDRLEDTGIEIQANGMVVTRGVIPSGKDTFTRAGLPFGTYRIFARQSNASSEAREVELSAAVPSAGVVLSLTRTSRSITLRYADGEPVSNAGFGNTTHGPEEIAPGTYSLASVAANTELLVRPPRGAPLCRMVPRDGDIQATVFPGRSLTMRFQNRRIVVDEIRIGSGEHCPASILLFLKSPLKVGTQFAEVEVLNAPPDDVLIIQTREGAYQVAVPPDGVVFIPAKQ